MRLGLLYHNFTLSVVRMNLIDHWAQPEAASHFDWIHPLRHLTLTWPTLTPFYVCDNPHIIHPLPQQLL